MSRIQRIHLGVSWERYQHVWGEKILKQYVLLPSFNEREVSKQFIPHFSNICVFHKSYLHVFYGKIAPLTASVIKVFTNLLPDKLKVAGHIFLESHKGELSAHLLLTFDDAWENLPEDFSQMPPKLVVEREYFDFRSKKFAVTRCFLSQRGSLLGDVPMPDPVVFFHAGIQILQVLSCFWGWVCPWRWLQRAVTFCLSGHRLCAFEEISISPKLVIWFPLTVNVLVSDMCIIAYWCVFTFSCIFHGWPLLPEWDGEISLGKREEKVWAGLEMLGRVSCKPRISFLNWFVVEPASVIKKRGGTVLGRSRAEGGTLVPPRCLKLERPSQLEMYRGVICLL